MDSVLNVQLGERRRSLSNPFFQASEEDLRQEALAGVMKDDLEKLYTTDKLPRVSELALPLSHESASGAKILKTRLWCWTGSVWRAHKAWLTEEALVVKRVGAFPVKSFLSWCEGRTVRQNSYLAFAVEREDRLLVVWFDDASLFAAFVAAFRGVWEANKQRKGSGVNY